MITGLVFLALLTFLFIHPSMTNAQGTIMGYCASNLGQPVVYFSAIFDSTIPSHVRRLISRRNCLSGLILLNKRRN